MNFTNIIFSIKTRLLSAIIMVSIFLLGILYSKVLYSGLMAIGTWLMLKEWKQMTGYNRFFILGVVIILLTTISLSVLRWRNCPLLLPYFTTIWTVDTIAMIAGRLIQGPKLAPKISPNKTWSGFIIGVIAAGLSAKIMSMTSLMDVILLPLHSSFLSGSLVAALAQLSDLFISIFKRKFNIKDFSNIIPGHGGVMDRFDSFVLTAPLTLVWYTYST